MSDIDNTTHYAHDTLSSRLWVGQERSGINAHGRVERVTLMKREPIGDVDAWVYDMHSALGAYEYSSSCYACLVVERWPLITAGQLRKPAAPSLETHNAITAERARILAAWVDEMKQLGDGDPYCESMAQLQPWFERMVNEVPHERT